MIGIDPKLLVGAAGRRSDLQDNQRFHQKCAGAFSRFRADILGNRGFAGSLRGHYEFETDWIRKPVGKTG
jgi:hypothetical protein